MSDINNVLNERNVKAVNHCRCHEHRELARAYVPMQGFGEMFSPEIGLRKGTIFPDLFSPYVPLTQSGR